MAITLPFVLDFVHCSSLIIQSTPPRLSSILISFIDFIQIECVLVALTSPKLAFINFYEFLWHAQCLRTIMRTSKFRELITSVLFQGYKESSFVYAISSAGVVHNIAKACSQGRLMSCGCDPYINRRNLIKTLRNGGGGDAIDSIVDEQNFMRSTNSNRIEENKIARWDDTHVK